MARPQSLTNAELLIEQHYDLVPRVVGRNISRLPEVIDRGMLEGEGYVGLWQAAERYVEKPRDYDFEFFARRIIYNKIIDAVRKELGRTDMVSEAFRLSRTYVESLDDDLGGMQKNELQETSDIDDDVARVMSDKLMILWIKEYPSIRDRTILFFRFFCGWIIPEIADWCGVSENAIHGRLKEILNKERKVRGVFQTEDLTEKELLVLQHVANGLGTPEIAEAVGLGEETIKTRRKTIIAKLGAVNLYNAISIGYRQGILT